MTWPVGASSGCYARCSTEMRTEVTDRRRVLVDRQHSPIGRQHSPVERQQALIERQRAGLARARQAALVLLVAAEGGLPPISDGQLIWSLLAARCPGLAEWASYFALCEGNPVPSQRQVDDLLRDLPVFVDLVAARHG